MTSISFLSSESPFRFFPVGEGKIEQPDLPWFDLKGFQSKLPLFPHAHGSDQFVPSRTKSEDRSPYLSPNSGFHFFPVCNGVETVIPDPVALNQSDFQDGPSRTVQIPALQSICPAQPETQRTRGIGFSRRHAQPVPANLQRSGRARR